MDPAAILRLLTACGAVDSGGASAPTPDASWLDPFLTFDDVALVGARAPARMRADARTGLSFVVDPETGVYVIESIGVHDGSTICADALVLGTTGTQGGCPTGTIELRRGFWPVVGAVDVAIDEGAARLWIVSEDGTLTPVPLDPVAVGADAWRRPGIGVPTGVAGVRAAVFSGGRVWLATDDALISVDERGGDPLTIPSPHPEPFVVDPAASPGWRDDAGWWAPGATTPLPAEQVAVAAGRVVRWSEGVLHPPFGAEVPWPDRPRALALGASGVVWVLGEGLSRLDGGERADASVAGQDLLVTATHDLYVRDGAVLRALYDERALVDARPPVWASSLTTLEHPNQSSVPIVCEGSDGIPERLARAARTTAWLHDLPGASAWGLAVSARFAEGVATCDARAAFEAGVDGFDVGFMLHEPTSCPDAGCYAAEARDHARSLRRLGVDPTWGTAFHAAELDWIEAVREVGLDRYLLFGAAIRSDVPQDGLLAKESYPVLPGDGTAAWRVASTEGIPPPVPWFPAWVAGCAPAPAVSLYPGQNRAAASQDGCAGLLYAECILLERNSGYFSVADEQALARSVRHAIARRSVGVTSWTWHLADLGTWDYAAGCEAVDGRPEGCELSSVAHVLDDLERLTRAGVVVPLPPSRLPVP